ncbi:MAG: hypothetical protein ACI97A_002943 [Planctomycetota bacterium]
MIFEEGEMAGPVDLVFFGIQAALRIAQAARVARIEDTIKRSVTFPIPQAFDNPVSEAILFAEQLEERQVPRFENYRLAYSNYYASGITVEGQAVAGLQLADLYLEDMAAGRIEGRRSALDRQRAGRTALKQWGENSAPFPTAIQRIAGSLAEVAVDYFVQIPGALKTNSKTGRVVKTFLEAIDDVKFEEATWDQILVEFFDGAVRTLRDHPDVFSEESGHQEWIKQLFSGVAEETQAKVVEIRSESSWGDFEREDRLKEYGSLVLRSSLKNAGQALLQSEKVLDPNNDGDKAVVRSVGSALLDLLLEETDSEGGYVLGDALRRTASYDGLENIALVAIRAAADHPSIFRIGSKSIEVWLSNVLTGLYARNEDPPRLFRSGIFGDVAYLAIDNGLRDLPGLLGGRNGTNALVVQVVRSVFEQIAVDKDGEDVAWRFDLSADDAKAIFSQVLEAISAHPDWIGKSAKQRALTASVAALLADVLGTSKIGFRNLIRSEKLGSVFLAILNSGIAKKIGDDVDAADLARVLDAVAKGVLKNGSGGLASVLLDQGYLNDLLSALATAGFIQRILDAEEAESKKLVSTLVQLVTSLRSGERLDIPTMVKELKAA